MNRRGHDDKWVDKKWTVGQRFGANVSWFRREAGLTQQELADRIGVKRSELSLIERGDRLPGLLTILKLVAGLEVENCDLVAWMWWDPPEHFHQETGSVAAEIEGYAVWDFDIPARFRVSPVGYETRERFKDRLRQRFEDPAERDVLDALRDDTPKAPPRVPPDKSWLLQAGSALRALREARELTPDDLAARTRTTATFIVQLEDAACSNPALKMFDELCEALDGEGSELASLIQQLRAPREAAREKWIREVRKIAGRDEEG
jgi:transcriptional regulator with XRE-family HTH domain